MIQVGKPVKGNAFIGRKSEVKEIINYLNIGQSVVIIAPRRFGKTSLVLEVLSKLKRNKDFTGYLDVFEFSTINQLTQNIISLVLENNGLKKAYEQAKGSIVALMKNIHLKATVEDFEFLLGMEDKTIDEWTKFSNAIDFIDGFAKKHNKQLHFAFDEYGDILKFDQHKNIVKLMRAKIQKQDNSNYIFSGSYESVMDTLFVKRKSPFYRLAKIIEIGYLQHSEVKKHMISMMKKHNSPYSTKLIEDCIDFLKGHPYYCQLCLQQMYLYNMTHSDKLSLDQLIEIIMQSERGYLEKSWDEFSGNKEAVLILKHLSEEQSGVYALASEKKINASRTLKTLEGKGVIYKNSDGYQYYDPIFQYYVASRIKA